MIRLHMPTGPLPANLTLASWRDHVEHILGDHVYGEVILTSDRSRVYKPAWNTCLELGFQIRRKAIWLVNQESMSLHDAPIAARKDREVVQK